MPDINTADDAEAALWQLSRQPAPAYPPLPETVGPTDMPATPEGGVVMPGNVAALPSNVAVLPPGRRGNQFSQMQASDPEIAAAVQQLNAGVPVTALPTQTWSLDQQRAYNERLTQFDRTAAATKLASEQAARDAALLDQMSRVAKSSKDITIALQQQDEIGFRNAVASGVPPVQALTRYPRAASSSMVALAKAAGPTPQATWVPQVGDAPGHFQLPGGGVNVPPAAKVAKDFQPQESTLSDGTKLVYNPNTGAFKLVPVKGEEKPLTASQLVAIANALPSKDPNAKTIFSFLSSKATNQLSAPAPAKGAPAAAPAPVARVRRKSDGKLFNYRGNPGDIPRDQYDVLP